MLDGTSNEKRQAREALVRLLAGETDRQVAEKLVNEMAALEPTLRELASRSTWASAPTVTLVAAVRQNTAPADWLAALTWLPPIPDSAIRAM
jgi:hypothetical protein